MNTSIKRGLVALAAVATLGITAPAQAAPGICSANANYPDPELNVVIACAGTYTEEQTQNNLTEYLRVLGWYTDQVAANGELTTQVQGLTLDLATARAAHQEDRQALLATIDSQGLTITKQRLRIVKQRDKIRSLRLIINQLKEDQ